MAPETLDDYTRRAQRLYRILQGRYAHFCKDPDSGMRFFRTHFRMRWVAFLLNKHLHPDEPLFQQPNCLRYMLNQYQPENIQDFFEEGIIPLY